MQTFCVLHDGCILYTGECRVDIAKHHYVSDQAVIIIFTIPLLSSIPLTFCIMKCDTAGVSFLTPWTTVHVIGTKFEQLLSNKTGVQMGRGVHA